MKSREHWSPTCLGTGTRFVKDNFLQIGGGCARWGAVFRWKREQWRAADETTFDGPQLISCCAARFPTGRGKYGSVAQGLGTLAIEHSLEDAALQCAVRPQVDITAARPSVKWVDPRCTGTGGR